MTHLQISETSDGAWEVSCNYCISLDDGRLDTLTEAIPARSTVASLSESQHVALGRFLGYPEQVVQDWLEYDSESPTVFDTLSEEEILNQLGSVSGLLEALDVEAAAFAEFVLPYQVPADTDIPISRVLDDLERYLLGAAISEELSLELVPPLLTQYRWVTSEV